jgi:hypothetical protein
MALTYVGDASSKGGKGGGSSSGGGKGGAGGPGSSGGPGGGKRGSSRLPKRKGAGGRRGSLTPAATVGPAAAGVTAIAEEAQTRMQRVQRARASVVRRGSMRDQQRTSFASPAASAGGPVRSSVRSRVSGVSSSASASTDKAKAFKTCCRSVFIFLFTQVSFLYK